MRVNVTKKTSFLNRQQRAHSPQLAAGLASESKIGKIPYREDSLQLAAGYSSTQPYPESCIIHEQRERTLLYR
jgi:hypothetical protein